MVYVEWFVRGERHGDDFGLYIDSMGHCMSFGKRPFHDDSVLLMSIFLDLQGISAIIYS